MTLVGAVGALTLIIGGKQPLVFHGRVYVEVGRAWGGVSLGAFFFVGSASALSLKQHEAGHTIQNLIFGPLMPFVVCIPSAFRCVLRDCTFTGKKIVAGVVTALVVAVSLTGAVLGFLYGLTALGVAGLLMALYGALLRYGCSSARYRSTRAAHMWTMMPCGLREMQQGAEKNYRSK